MNIQVDLVSGWEKTIIMEIDRLKSIGFEFDSKTEWEKKRHRKLMKRKKKAEKMGNSVSRINIELAQTDIQKSFEQDLIYSYFNFQRRLIEPKPRVVSIAKDVICPTQHQKGYHVFLKKVEHGDNLFPHLSRQIFDPYSNDGMLFDFGFQHFHLGLEPDPKYPSLVKGYDDILYGIVTSEKFYVIKIAKHGLWANDGLIEIVKNEFPEYLENWNTGMKNPSILEVTEQQRLKARKVGMNIPIAIDGETYFSPGGGFNSCGGSPISVMQVDHMFHLLKKAENIMKQELQKVETEIVEVIGPEPDACNFVLKEYNRKNICAYSKEHSLLACLFFNETGREYSQFTLQKDKGT